MRDQVGDGRRAGPAPVPAGDRRAPRWDAYVEASREVRAIFDRTSPVVECISIDEAFLDVTGMERIAGSAEQIARTLRSTVHSQVGLPISVGVASTKVVAKLASGWPSRTGCSSSSPGPSSRSCTRCRSAAMGRRRGTAEKLHRAGLHTVADLARAGEPALVAAIGRAAGRHLYAVAHNRVVRPVRSGRGRRSLGSQRALGWPGTPPGELDRCSPRSSTA